MAKKTTKKTTRKAPKKATPRSWVCVEPKSFKASMDELRDLVNWLAVMQEEYEFTSKDAKATRRRLDKAVRLLEKGLQ